jgi:hypothetical protein
MADFTAVGSMAVVLAAAKLGAAQLARCAYPNFRPAQPH